MARDFCRKKCAKCKITATEDKKLSFHRFPLPGKHGISRTRVWAEYCYPDEDWSSEQSLKNLHFQHKMLCSKHFNDSCYTNRARTRLNIFAIPTSAQDLPKERMEVTLSLTDRDGKFSAEKSHLDIMGNNTELENHCHLKSVKIKKIETNHSTLIHEAELVRGETSDSSMSLSKMDTITDSKAMVSVEQTSILCNFFEENPEVIRGYKQTPKSMVKVQIKWKNITPHLNAVGPPRDHRSWAKYLCDIKAKLKRKNIKWRQSCDGKDHTMCNANDFNEIRLRMLQVLRKDISDSQESQDSHTSDLERVDSNNYDNDLKDENYEMDTLPEEILDVKPKLECFEQNGLVLNDTPPPDLQPPQWVLDDEFDYFGKNVAEQLRTLPLIVALETQEMLLSVLKKQRLKVLSNSDPLSINGVM